jgi:MFS family permease
MTHILRLWWPLLLAIALIQAGNGVSGTLVSVTSEARAFAPWLKGLVLSAFYIGSLAGALGAPAVIGRLGHIMSFTAFTALLALATAGFAADEDPYAWVMLRAAAGAGITGMFATVESWLNLGTKDAWRARVFSIYILVQLGGQAAGQFLLNARGWGDEVLFLCAAGFSLAAMLCLRFESVQNPAFVVPRRLAVLELARRAPLGVACAALAGFAWAGLVASGPALVELIGLDDFAKSLFMALAIVSGMVAQLPIGWAADHADRRLVLAGMTAAAGAAALLGLAGGATWVLLAFAVAFGAATFPLYGVGVARTNEILHQGERTAASAAMIVFFEVGAIAAPLILAFATAIAGPPAYFVVMALPQLAFACAAVVALRRRAVQPQKLTER